jgi:hypothetical protein
VATWAALSPIVLAIDATTAGLIALIGAAGLGLGILLMIFVGNPFSGATSAPELLPASTCSAARPTSTAMAPRVTSRC